MFLVHIDWESIKYGLRWDPLTAVYRIFDSILTGNDIQSLLSHHFG